MSLEEQKNTPPLPEKSSDIAPEYIHAGKPFVENGSNLLFLDKGPRPPRSLEATTRNERPARQEAPWRTRANINLGAITLGALVVGGGFVHVLAEADRQQAETERNAGDMLGAQFVEMTDLLLEDGSTVVTKDAKFDENDKTHAWTIDATATDTVIHLELIRYRFDEMGNEVQVTHETDNGRYEVHFKLSGDVDFVVDGDPRESIESITTALENPDNINRADSYQYNELGLGIGGKHEAAMQDFQEIINKYNNQVTVPIYD